MSMKQSFQVVFAIAVFGLAFSGYLSYRELFAGSTAESCPPVGTPGTVLGYPACIYGFFMYLTIVVVSAIGLRHRGHEQPTAHTALPSSS